MVATAVASSACSISTPIATLVIGFSAPALLKKLSKTVLERPVLGSGSDVSRPSIMGFLSD